MQKFCGCPGSQEVDRRDEKSEGCASEKVSGEATSELRQWPLQLHLVSPQAPYYQNADVVLAADCVAFTMGNFHSKYLKGKSLAIACPKLDDGQDIYVEKLKAMIDQSNINTLTVVIMQVPCCSGLLALAKKALSEAERKIPLKAVVISLKGDVLQESWA